MEDETQPEGDWYYVVDEAEIHQGDVLRDFPVAVVQTVRNVGTEPTVFLKQLDVVVLTQTCDIPKKAQTSLLLAQVASYDNLVRTGTPDQRSRQFRKTLAQNSAQAFFLLRPNEELKFPWSVVSFRDLHVSPKDEVHLYAAGVGARLRLRSPYREHLSQSYGRFIMRVGLPSTTHDFEKYEPPTDR